MPKPLRIASRPISSLQPYEKNARTHSEDQVNRIARSIDEFGFLVPVLIDADGGIIAGHGRVMAAKQLGMDKIPTISVEHLSEKQKRAYILADNKLALDAGWDQDLLLDELLFLQDAEYDTTLTGFSDEEMEAMLGRIGGSGGSGERNLGTLSERFMIPPFSVWNAREGWWQDRKKFWLGLGIRSEVGRGEGGRAATGGSPMPSPKYLETGERGDGKGLGNATSVFDPVVCELAYRWFSPEGGTVLDPFAGGSVRGIVASMLGRPYVGVELRAEQVEANRIQAIDIVGEDSADLFGGPDQMPELTPIEEHGGHKVKRDDLFAIGGGRGGKVRTCWHLAQGAKGLVTAGSRASPQVNIVAQIAARLGIPCRAHVPSGDLAGEVLDAQAAGAEIIQHDPGYNNVIIARAREDAAERGWTEIPFGMECQEAIEQTRAQVENLPPRTKRIVIPCGSGMSLAGLLWGLKDQRRKVEVLAVQVGADPEKRLDKYAPEGWRDMVELVKSDLDYHAPAPEAQLGELALDPIYEAKCLPFLEKGDLLWVVGLRKTAVPNGRRKPTWHIGDSREIGSICEGLEADLIFSCPPYADLEVYSDDPADISTMKYPEFKEAYFQIVKRSCELLKDDRFAVFVVGEARGKDGLFYNFLGDTIEAFLQAGLRFYNEAILVTPVGSLPIRVGKGFSTSRKLGKTHQNVLVFVKGDPKKATRACGAVEVALPSPDEEV